MLRKTSQIRHISYIEFNEMIKSLLERLKDHQLHSINPLEPRDLIPAAFIAQKLNIPIDYNSPTTFSIYNDKIPIISFFAKNYESDLYNIGDTLYLEEIDVDPDGYHQEVKFEWEK